MKDEREEYRIISTALDLEEKRFFNGILRSSRQFYAQQYRYGHFLVYCYVQEMGLNEQQAGATDSLMNGSKPPPPGFGLSKRADFNHLRLIDT